MPPPKLTHSLATKLAEALKALPVKLACALVGITEAAYYAWRKRAERGEEPYASLIGLCEQARAEKARDLLGAIEEAGLRGSTGDWKALAWALQKLQPTVFGDSARQQGPAEDGDGDAPEGNTLVIRREPGKKADDGTD